MASDPKKSLQNTIDSERLIYKFAKTSEKFALNKWLKPSKLIVDGAYSSVCEAIDLRNIYYKRKYTIKKYRHIFSNLSDARRIYKEMKLLMHFSHPCIVSLYNVVPPLPSNRDTYRDIYLIMPKYDTTLKNVIASKQKLTERHIQYFAYQILRALEYIHSANIIYYNLRPENILVKVSNCQIQLTDFTRCIFSDECLNNTIGLDSFDEYIWSARWYRAPEIFCDPAGKCKTGKTPKIDIWAFACIVVELYIRRPLFKGRNHIEMIQLMFHYLGTPTDLLWVTVAECKRWIYGMDIKKGKDMASILTGSTEKAQEFVKSVLVINPNQRPDASTVLKHEWLKVNDSDYKQCPTFVMPKYMKTQFQMRHLFYEELCNYNMKVVKKEEKESKWFWLYCKILIQGYFRQSNVEKTLKEQYIDLILIIMTQQDYIGDCKGLLFYVQRKINNTSNCNNKPLSLR